MGSNRRKIRDVEKLHQTPPYFLSGQVHNSRNISINKAYNVSTTSTNVTNRPSHNSSGQNMITSKVLGGLHSNIKLGGPIVMILIAICLFIYKCVKCRRRRSVRYTETISMRRTTQNITHDAVDVFHAGSSMISHVKENDLETGANKVTDSKQQILNPQQLFTELLKTKMDQETPSVSNIRGSFSDKVKSVTYNVKKKFSNLGMVTKQEAGKEYSEQEFEENGFAFYVDDNIEVASSSQAKVHKNKPTAIIKKIMNFSKRKHVDNVECDLEGTEASNTSLNAKLHTGQLSGKPLYLLEIIDENRDFKKAPFEKPPRKFGSINIKSASFKDKKIEDGNEKEENSAIENLSLNDEETCVDIRRLRSSPIDIPSVSYHNLEKKEVHTSESSSKTSDEKSQESAVGESDEQNDLLIGDEDNDSLLVTSLPKNTDLPNKSKRLIHIENDVGDEGGNRLSGTEGEKSICGDFRKIQQEVEELCRNTKDTDEKNQHETTMNVETEAKNEGKLIEDVIEATFQQISENRNVIQVTPNVKSVTTNPPAAWDRKESTVSTMSEYSTTSTVPSTLSGSLAKTDDQDSLENSTSNMNCKHFDIQELPEECQATVEGFETRGVDNCSSGRLETQDDREESTVSTRSITSTSSGSGDSNNLRLPNMDEKLRKKHKRNRRLLKSLDSGLHHYYGEYIAIEFPQDIGKEREESGRDGNEQREIQQEQSQEENKLPSVQNSSTVQTEEK
ncbi:hypothetical protein HHI36_017615 [Cryptolaemus montrouzieri]|uniref:Uncharacterized protein n=1 Tax=Cryptolaemus montrouzieri TaxID=559131 RepID=A0ABD2NNE3_9CUCU